MNKLLSHDLWTELGELTGEHGHLEAAIAFVTKPHLNFKAGDVLICEASDKAIRAGSTNAQTLQTLAAKGVHLYGKDGLSWTKFEKLVAQLGMNTKLKPTSVKELKGNAARIIQLVK